MRTTTKLTRSNSLQTADLVATGREFRKQDRFEEALAAFDEAIRLAPAFPKAHAGRALTLARLELLAPSVESFREAVRLDPDLWRAWNSLAGVYNRIGDRAGAIYASRRAAEISNDSSAGSNLLLTLNCDPTLAPADLLEEHRRWAARHAPLRDRHAPFPDRHASSAAHPPHANLPTMGRRLRIGYVSGDFRRHALLFVFEPLLAAHDRDAFEITCFDNTRKPDAHTERLRAMADHWHIIRDMTDDCAEALIRSCAIDILVDLSGHTAWNRLPLFGRKPAPVQATYAGYPNTTGVPAMDYRIVDALTDPADTWLTERALRLPRCFLSYRPLSQDVDVNPLPAQSGAPFTFGSFSKPMKWSDPALAAWAEVLRRVPGSRLVLHHGAAGRLGPGVSVELRAGVDARFRALGIDPERITITGTLPDHEHFSLFKNVDLMLDPFPYNGATAILEALWMGVPSIGLAGNTHVTRVALSLMSAVGLPEFVAHSTEEYVDTAVRIARDVPRLAAIRASLRERMLRSELMDHAGLARAVEDAYREMWSALGSAATCAAT